MAVERTTSAVLVLAMGFGVAASAAAQESGEERVYVVTVARVPQVDVAAIRAGAAARAALRGVEGVHWRTADQRFLGYDPQALERLEDAREALEQGKQAFIEFQLDRAIELLNNSVEAFEAGAEALEDAQDIGEALLFLGASQVFQGNLQDADETFARLHIQMPGVEPDPETFNPEVVERFKKAAPRDARAPRATLRVQSEPPGALVYVDFVPRGRTPIELEGMVSGEHFVRVSRPGSIPAVETRTLRWRRTDLMRVAMGDNPSSPQLDEAIGNLDPAAVEDEGLPEAVAEVARLLELDRVGVLVVDAAGQGEVSLELAVFDVASGRRLVTGERNAPAEGQPLRAAVSALVTAGVQRVTAATQEATDGEAGTVLHVEDPKEEDEAREAPVWKQWWLWTAVGAVVVAGVTVGAVLGTKGGDGNQTDRPAEIVFRFGP